MLLTDVATPGLMISQTWPNSRERQGETLRAIESALQEDFFAALQTVEIPYPSERYQIAQSIVGQKVSLTYCVTRVLNDNKLNLSSLDEKVRLTAVGRVIQCLDDARQLTARNIHLVSGPAPTDPTRRSQALLHLTDSIGAIAHEAATDPPVGIIVEPLDAFAHKKGSLGLTVEAVKIVQSLRNDNCDVALCLDTAHMALNGEDILTSLAPAKDYASQFHFCNCVTDPKHELFGDRHIPFGPPGILDMDQIADIMVQAVRMGFLHSEYRRGLFCEIFNNDPDNFDAGVSLMRHWRATLENAWNITQEQLSGKAE